VDIRKYVADKLSEAAARLEAAGRECDRTAGLRTRAGSWAYATARALYESDRRQVVYWTREASRIECGAGWWGRRAA
jgi:hypothetical protein